MDDILALGCDPECSAGDDSSIRNLKSQDEDMTALIPEAGDDLSMRNLKSHNEGMLALTV